jgi:hypothetical protein
VEPLLADEAQKRVDEGTESRRILERLLSAALQK